MGLYGLSEPIGENLGPGGWGDCLWWPVLPDPVPLLQFHSKGNICSGNK